jgi:hypothetical protein
MMNCHIIETIIQFINYWPWANCNNRPPGVAKGVKGSRLARSIADGERRGAGDFDDLVRTALRCGI